MVHAAELIGRALEIASGADPRELPIAAVIVDSTGKTLASAANAVEITGETTAHAEVLAIRQIKVSLLKQLGKEMTIAVTLEPCPMCAWAIRAAGIGRLVFGSFNSRFGAAGSVYDLLRDSRHGPRVEVIAGVRAKECQELIDSAFEIIRDNRDR